MTELVGQGQGRERYDRDERSFAWDLPVDAHIVALVCDSSDAERGATVVDAIATAIARRREHTLVLSAEVGPCPLDQLLGGSGSEGLPAALGGRARLTDVAVQKGNRPFVYLPAGSDSAAIHQLLRGEVLPSFIARVQERGGMLFMVVSENTSFSDGVRALLDGYVVLGDVTVPGYAEGLTAFGRVRFDEFRDDSLVSHKGNVPERTVDETESDGVVARSVTSIAPDTDEVAELSAHPLPTNTWVQHQTKRQFPVKHTGIGVGAMVLIFSGWWWIGRSTAAGEEKPLELTGLDRVEVSSSPTMRPPLDPADARRVVGNAPELPFSVLIASYESLVDAEARITELKSEVGAIAKLYFISPTLVRRVLYHRVLAGAVADETEADVLMKRLVAAGEKDEASAWHLRPSGLGFDLGVFKDRESVEARVAELAVKGVPSYVLVATLGDRNVYQVYGGGYGNQRESLPMAELLGAAREPAVLIERHGGTVFSPSP